VVVSSKGKKTGKTKIKQNRTKQKKKNPQSVPSSNAIQLQQGVWRQFCEWLSEVVARLPAAVSLLLLKSLFMQISGVSLTLTWPCRLCLLRVLLCVSRCYKLSPFQAHWGR
jgi:hypothetical protein